jgi:hypothetical protein
MIALFATCATLTLSAQMPANPTYADRGYPRFGEVIGKAGDVNGDGVPDLILGDPGGQFYPGKPTPTFWLVSGRDGTVLQRIKIPERPPTFYRYHDCWDLDVPQGFEYRAEGGIDLDSDGTPDFFVEISPIGFSPPREKGELSFYSGKDGHVLRSLETCSGCGANSRDSIHFVSDLDHDGVADVAMLCPLTTEKQGTVVVYSGKTGERLVEVPVENESESTIGGLVEVGDVDADRAPDFAVLLDAARVNADLSQRFGASYANEHPYRSSLRLYSTSGRRKIWDRQLMSKTFSGRSALTRLGDISGDGIAELAAGFDENVEVIDGKTGAYVLHFARANTSDMGFGFGCALASLGDIDRDGVPDYVFSEYDTGWYSGMLMAKSGEDGHQIWSIETDLETDDVHHFGNQLAALGDIDGDGICDLLVAGDMRACGVEPGVAEVLSGKNGALLFRFTRKGDDVVVTCRANTPAKTR